MNLKSTCFTVALPLGAVIDGDAALAQVATARWSPGCPADGVTSVAQRIGRSGRSGFAYVPVRVAPPGRPPSTSAATSGCDGGGAY